MRNSGLILKLGGCGNVGKRISEAIAKQSNISLLIAGRTIEKPN
jgi:saccharopine dehydrogenase-like NADP-dependent oxidoreductase